MRNIDSKEIIKISFDNRYGIYALLDKKNVKVLLMAQYRKLQELHNSKLIP